MHADWFKWQGTAARRYCILWIYLLFLFLLLDAVHDKDLELARLILIAGCFMLPWLWFLNIFYFLPKLKRGCGKGDPADIRDANWRRLRFCSWLEPAISFSSNHSAIVQLMLMCVNVADIVCEIIGIASFFLLWLIWIITLSSTWRKSNFWGINLWVEDSPAW